MKANLFNCKSSILLLGFFCNAVILYAQTKNYIRTWDATAPVTVPMDMLSKPLKDVKMATQYFDGLGRPLQTVVKEGSLQTGTNPTDMVAHFEYDGLGRQEKNYLPYPDASAADGLYKSGAVSSQGTALNLVYGSQGESIFYGMNVFEPSPLNRTNKSMSAGNSWAGSGRGIEGKNWSNTTTDDVKTFGVSTSFPSLGGYWISGNYLPNTLTKIITVDEHGKQVIEFKDDEDKLILKKVQLTAAADNGNGSGYPGWLSTYYIYDDVGNLRCVVQPEGVLNLIPAGSFTTTILNQQCFRYEYDSYNRMIIKKVPGAELVYMVYDMRNRLVMTQDANMRGNSQWLYTSYDNLNRPISTGLITDFNSHSTHLANAAASSTYPNLSGADELTRIFYEDYNWLSNYGNPLSSSYDPNFNGYFEPVNGSWPYAQSNAKSDLIKGLATGSRVKVLGTSSYLYTVNVYDEKARIIQVYSTNNTGGVDMVTIQYTWAGQQLVTIQKQSKADSPAQESVVVTKSSYDDLGRLTTTEKKVSYSLVSSGSMPSYKIISENEYDKLGQIKRKRLSPTSPSTQLESLNYEYNIRGWLLGMNRDYAKDLNNNNYFGFDLGYDKGNNGIIGSHSYNNAQYNGNIEGTVWKSRGDGQKRRYDFVYDAANRLLNANFTQYTSGSFNTSAQFDFSVALGNAYSAGYDANGNILHMQQSGWKITGSGEIDNMRYAYSGSNRLQSVTDVLNNPLGKTGDFKTLNSHPNYSAKSALLVSSTQTQYETITDYNYDNNGNLVFDYNKGISSITYNHLNLPATVTITGKGTITYQYDAAGNKLKKTTVDNSIANKTVTTVTTYIGGFVYESKTYSPADPYITNYTDELQFIAQEEGRIRFFKSTPSNCPAQPDKLVYDYFIKDHLGNVRSVLTEQQDNICYIPATVENNTYTQEQRIYDIDDSRRIDKATTGATQSSFGNKLYRTHGGITNQKTGLGAVIKVMNGDQISIVCESYYDPASGSLFDMGAPSISDLFSAFVGTSVAGAHGGILNTDIPTIGTNSSNISGFMSGRTLSSGNAKAFVNWILLDEQFKFVAGDAEEVQNGGGYKMHVQFINNPVIASTNGFLYVYVSNESNLPVYFDNLAITHTPGKIIEETHYYPFGLTMNGISSKALAYNKQNVQRYNGKENQTNEFEDGSGLEAYDYGARMYDPQVGRWFQQDPMAEKYFGVSPYNYCLNNPISLFDYDGRDAIIIIDFETKKITIISTIYVKGGKPEERDEYINAGNEFVRNKENAHLFNGKFNDGTNEWSMAVEIKYEDIGSRKIDQLEAGSNYIDLSKLDETAYTSNAGGGPIQKKDENNRPTGGYESLNAAGRLINLRDDSKKWKGLTMVHETFHVLGLSDRYVPNSSKSHAGFETDVMGAAMGRKQGPNGTDIAPTMSQTHWNNWGNFILSPPQLQQQQNQNNSQFILKYQVDVQGGPGKRPNTDPLKPKRGF